MTIIAFTVGRTTNYERGLHMRKVGRTEDYDGGCVFRTIPEAQAFIDQHGYPYSVYQLVLQSDADVDWAREAELGYGLLLVDTPITALCRPQT